MLLCLDHFISWRGLDLESPWVCGLACTCEALESRFLRRLSLCTLAWIVFRCDPSPSPTAHPGAHEVVREPIFIIEAI